MEKDTVWVNSNGAPVNFSKDSGVKARKKVTEYGRPQKAAGTKVNGNTTNKTVKGPTIITAVRLIGDISKIF